MTFLKKLGVKKLGVLCAALAISAPAYGAVVTVGFDDLASGVYDAGTDFSGLSFDSAIQLGDGDQPPPGFNFLAGPGMSGQIARQFTPPFGAERGGSIGGMFDGFTVSSLSLVAGDVGFDTDMFNLSGFDADGALVAETGIIGSDASTTLSIEGAGIASFFLFIEDQAANSQGSSGFDNIRFDTEDLAAVPLPASLPLFGFGLAALGLVKRRRKKSA